MSRMADRQLAILRILESGRKVKIRGICDRTESSRSTVLRDLIDLSAYYPIYIVRGRYGGVRMDPVAVVGRQYLMKTELAYIFDVVSVRPSEDGEIRNSVLQKINSKWDKP